MDMDTSEKRSYFRVDDHINLRCKTVAGAEAERLARRLEEGGATCSQIAELQGLSVQMSNVLASIRKSDPEVAQYLAMLDRKIDAVAKLAEEQRLGADLAPNARVNIGAGGMIFPSETDYPPGTRLDLRLVFFPSYLCIRALGEVVRSEPVQDAADGSQTVAVEFTAIDEESREALIRHLTERQAALLRQRQRD